MATGSQVLEMLCPAGGWVIYGDDFDSIVWTDNRPSCTKAEFEAGFEKVEAWKAEQNATQATAKAALLARLGITEEQAKLLLS
jgi:hypothetical protein